VRKIKSHFFIALDGVVEAPDKWRFPYFDDEMGLARLFPPEEPTVRLELRTATTFSSGVLNLSYAPAEG
jgi:hypothetical protein